MDNRIYFLPNYHRIVDIICWFFEKNQRQSLGVHQIMKLLFFADVANMNQDYVPMTGGRYLAMPYGPVHQEAYRVIKGEAIDFPDDIEPLPFDRKGNEIILNDKRNEMTFSSLTKTHKKILADIWDEYGDKNFDELTDISHRHIAWVNAWGNRQNNAPEMDYWDFFDKLPNEEIKTELIESARFITL